MISSIYALIEYLLTMLCIELRRNLVMVTRGERRKGRELEPDRWTQHSVGIRTGGAQSYDWMGTQSRRVLERWCNDLDIQSPSNMNQRLSALGLTDSTSSPVHLYRWFEKVEIPSREESSPLALRTQVSVPARGIVSPL